MPPARGLSLRHVIHKRSMTLQAAEKSLRLAEYSALQALASLPGECGTSTIFPDQIVVGWFPQEVPIWRD
jgi:hypothetical protein